MNDERRIEIGRRLLERMNELAGEGGVCEDTVRDAVCDVLHAAVKDGLIERKKVDVITGSCADHVRTELKEEADELWNRLAMLEERETMHAEAGQADQVRRIQHEMLPIKHRINQLESTVLYDEAEERPCPDSP